MKIDSLKTIATGQRRYQTTGQCIGTFKPFRDTVSISTRYDRSPKNMTLERLALIRALSV